jgi:hypothetical protein
MKELNYLKNYSLLIISCSILTACNSLNNKERNLALIEKDNYLFNIGTVKKDTLYTFEFFIKPIGNTPLIVDSVSRNCECTNVIFPHEPINEGDSAKFIVTYRPNKTDTIISSGFLVQANIKNYFVPIYFLGKINNQTN